MKIVPESIPYERFLALDIHKHYVLVGGMNSLKEWVLRPRKVRMSRFPEWVQKNLNPTEMGFGPIDEDVFTWDQQKRDRIRRLPGSLGEALHALEVDHRYLTESDVFSPEMVLAYARYKYEHEHMAVRNRPHPYEMKLYFEA